MPTPWLTTLALAALLAPAAPAATQEAAAPDEPVAMLKLWEGALLWGRIEGHDAEGLSFRRLDNGGRVRVPWSRLDPAQAEKLQVDFGYVDQSGDELLIEADKLSLDNGQEWIGRIVNRTDDEIWIKNASSLVRVPKLRLRGAATLVQVPALDVYTGEELYQQELARLDPQSPAGQLELALFCERILEFERALEHYRAAGELDPSFQPEELAARVARAEVKSANKAQLEYLREIDRLRGRGKYDQAVAQAQAFEEVFPQSSLAADARRKQLQVEKSREKALRERTVRAWHEWAGRLVQRKAREPELGLEAALSWVEDGLRDEVLSAVQQELARTVSQEVTPDQILRFWAERDDSVRPHRASYGEGTWLLGAEAARAGIPEAPKDESKLSETDRERARLEERVRRYLQNQSAVRTLKTSADQESEQATFWKRWSARERAQWMLALYAEKGGDMRLVRVLTSACIECGGSGVREIVNLNAAPGRPGQQGAAGQTEKVSCPLCRNVGVVRRIVFR